MGAKGIAMETRPKAMKTRPGPIALETRTNDIPPLLLCGGVEQIQSPKGTHAGRRFLYNTRWLVTMYIGWTASEVTPRVMVSMCVRSVGICVYRYNVHEMGGGREVCLDGGGREGGGRDVWRGDVWRERKLEEWEIM